MNCGHQLGRPCRKCGHIAIPVGYMFEGMKPVPYEKAVARWKEWARESDPAHYEKYLSQAPETIVTENVTDEGVSQVVSQKVCPACGEGFEGYGKNCSKCRKAKSRAK